MIKSLLLTILLVFLARQQTITPYYVLPVQTTQTVTTSYSFLFHTDTSITNNAWVAITFPFEFSPSALTQVSRIRYSVTGALPMVTKWSVNRYQFLIQLNQISIGNVTIVIDNVLNPTDYTTSSYFVVQTLFQNVVITSNSQFGRISFTKAPIATAGGTVANYQNTYIQQGSSWSFNFTLSTSYPSNSTLRFIFPEGFLSNKIQCNVSGNVDPSMQTRVFPAQNVYDCLNLQQALSGNLLVILSGIVNPNYEMTASGFQVSVLQPNSVVAQETVSSISTVLIQRKPLNTTVKIPNQYRNNSLTYIFTINTDTDLLAGDYLQFTFTGLWRLYTNQTKIISGVNSGPSATPVWSTFINTTSAITSLTLTNFSSILKSTQFTFYLPLVTPINPSTYILTITAYRSNAKIAQSYTNSAVVINQTTGYIRQMKLHPMQRAIKLPVGQTGPLEIVLFLQNNLPKTNVLTYGKIVMQITPNIPAPILALNGVPKCYFYGDIAALNCTFDSTSPNQTLVTIFTPADFNFQQSQVPLTITTEGFQQPQNQGITIDTLVKRYFFQIQFFSHLRPPPIPLEVIFDQWIPDSIPLTTLSCPTTTLNGGEQEHLKCTFVTPTQVLNSGGFIHFFRVEFQGTGWNIQNANAVNPNYPCLMYGVNVSAVPYVKCDMVTYTSGPYKSQQLTTSYNYITFYGLSTIPGGSTITFEVPNVFRVSGCCYPAQVLFSILEDTPGYNSPIVYLYTQTVLQGTVSGNTITQSYEIPSYAFSNSVINKVTSFTLNSYSLGTSGVTSVMLMLDQTGFPNIGRGSNIACGTHVCSKFDAPIQYFMLYPSSTLGSSATITFPSITTPPYSGSFIFNVRTFQSSGSIKKSYFYVSINPDTITTCSYTFSTLQTVTTLYPNSNRFYTISWTTVNPLVTLGGISTTILVTINNIFTLASTYCKITTAATSFDSRGIFCQLSTGSTQIYIKNLNNVAANTTFSLTVQMSSTSIAATVSPTVAIQTYYGNGALVDQVLSVPFTPTPLTNTNLTVLNSFSLPSAWTSTRSINAGYFGPLLISFTPSTALSVINGSQIIITMPTGFYPATSAGTTLNLPLRCTINGVRFLCTYTQTPFTITILNTINGFTASNNIINITTQYLNPNGIVFPSTQGRYLLQLEIQNTTFTTISLEKVQQYIDLLPPDVGRFNVTWAVRDINVVNIFTIQMQNGATPIPSYNNGATAGRIYFGFPMLDASSNPVFASNLGFSGITEGTVLPCYFDSTVTNAVTATGGQTLQCKIRLSQMTSYYTWIEVINFATVPANASLRIMVGKITNPAVKQIDINFQMKVTTLTVATGVEAPMYQTNYNMFIDMVSASIALSNQLNSSSIMFQPGSTVGQTNRYMNVTPYTTSSFSNNDWFVVNLDPQFPLSGTIYNCQQPFYQYCIIYPTINWLAIKIGNGTVISLQPFISQLPASISRVDTTYTCYTFLQGRWAQTITYTVTASFRWLQIRGVVSGFSFTVLGSQNKLNVGQKNVEVLVTFNVSHPVPLGGTIQIQFPNSPTLVPAIKPHCRSAVTMGSALNGYSTGKPAVNVQGEVGCLVQNGYSWIITGFAPLAAGSQVKIYGLIDFPLNATNSLGMGYVCTYSNQDATSAFANARTINYLTTNFPLSVQNLTWNLDSNFSMLQTGPLRINRVGELTFLLNLAQVFYAYTSGGAMNINLWYYSILGVAGGFSGPTTNLVCIITNPLTQYKYGCYLTYTNAIGTYLGYTIQTYQNLPANTNLLVTLTTQKGSATEGINFPSVVGSYKIQIEVLYSSGSSTKRNQAIFMQVYGSNFNMLSFQSTVTIPNENNFIIVQFTPSSNIAAGQQLVIEIPTIALDGQNQFPADLGMGYKNYDTLIFDLFESGITSMTCKVHIGNTANHQPTKIVCSSFSSTITTSTIVKFGFWVVNPSTAVAMAIPIQIYAYDQPSATKFCWSIVESGIRLLPITQTPITDIGNWASTSTYREIMSTSLSFTTRNTRAMSNGDWYILKFNFDLRNTANANGSFLYNAGLGSSGDVIFMRNSMTILLRVGSNALSILTPGVATISAKINSLFYNPSTQLTTSQASILAYVIYNTLDACEKVIYSDLFPTLTPNVPSSPTFTLTAVNSNNYYGANEDYQFSFTMSSTAGNSTSLVQLISIQFPAYSTVDMLVQGTQCHQISSSTIQVSNCTIDTVNRVIWIVPVVKSTYSNNNPLIIESAGLAFQNPILISSINANQFVIRYYTWPVGTSNPGVVAGSDDWCFMKQSSSIPSSAISYTSTYYAPHTSISVPNQVYVNEWQPADTNVGGTLSKSPLMFKLVSPAAFTAQTGNNYHTISLYFGAYYSTPTLNQNSNDLYYYVPTCQLNGFSIYSCSISSGTITMNFQQAINNGQIFSVRFSIVNPTNEADEGFILPNTANPTVTLPIYVTPYGGSNYYLQPEAFHTFYRTFSGSSYPSMGISNVAMSWGTQVQAKLNYLQFVITLTRTDINGLILQIPVVDDDGTKIYNNPMLMNLPSGSQYPCSLGVYTSVYCYYTQGSSTNFGTPTRIYVTDFSIPANKSLTFRMLFTNPDVVEVFPSFTFKAFGGSFSAPNLMGSEFMGMFKRIDPFKIYTAVGYYSTGTCTCYPNSQLWTPTSNYNCYINSNTQAAGSYAILQWPLVDPTYGIIGDYNNVGTHYDIFFMSTAVNQHYVYLVIKLTSTYNPSGSSYFAFGNIRMKHHIVNSYNLYLLGQPWSQLWTASVSSSWVWSTYTNGAYGGFSIDAIDVQDRYAGRGSWHYISINTGTAYNFPFETTDASTMVIEIRFNSGNTYASLGSSGQCSIESGVVGSDILNPITCYLDSANNRFIIYNVYKFTNTQLKIYYFATMASSQSGLTVWVRAFANNQAFVDYNWPIFANLANSGAYTLNNIAYDSNTGYNVKTTTQQALTGAAPSIASYTNVLTSSQQTDTSGYSQIITVTVTSPTVSNIKVRVYKSASQDFSQVYRMGFRFYTQRLNPTTCTAISIWSSRLGWGPYGASTGSWSSTCGTNGFMFYAIFSMYYQATTLNQWPYWYGGDYYDLFFTFNSISQDPTNNANYLFVTASILYENSAYYFNDNSKCGCCSTCCSHYCCGNNYACDCCFFCFDYTCCCDNSCCNYPCCSYCSCRYILSWNYFTLTGSQNAAWAQPSSDIASSVSIALVSNQFNVETQFSFYLQSLNGAISSLMNSGTATSNSQLLITFPSGNNAFPSGNPFQYTSNSDYAARIQCQCVVSSSAISISAGTAYIYPYCTRYIGGPLPAITVRLTAYIGKYVACYFPGFTTPSSSAYGWTMYANFYLDNMNFFKPNSIPQTYWTALQTQNVGYSLTNQGTINSLYDVNYYSQFWTTGGSVNQNKYYRLYVQSYYNLNSPVMYLSSYSPAFQQSICNSGTYAICRAYNVFYSRRYFLVVQFSGNTNSMDLVGNLNFPESRQYSTSYYTTYIGWTSGGYGYYHSIWTGSFDQGYFSDAAPAISYSPSIYGSNLKGYATSMSVSVSLSGFILYSNYRSGGAGFVGSFMRLTMSGFTSIYGCGAFLWSNSVPTWLNNAIYCTITNSNQLNIFSNADLALNDILYITINTASLPTSTNYIFQLFDRYVSGTNYGRAVYAQGTFARSVSGYTLIPPTSCKWRRQAYKQLMTGSGPIRFTLNNNYQYVSTYNQPGNAESTSSSAIVVTLPNGITSSTYYCIAREYPPSQFYLYTEYLVNCAYYTTNQVMIKSIPSHILTPNYFYDFIIYFNAGASANLITTVTTTPYIFQVATCNAYSGGSIQYNNYITVDKYQAVYPIVLNNIHILTQEAAAINSLFLNLVLNQATTTVYYLEFIFNNLDLKYFSISNGNQIPCYLATASFTTYGSKTNGPRCFGYANGVNNTSPLIIRVLNFGSFASGTNLLLAFDNFNNPPLQSLFAVPINVQVNFKDRTNKKVYTSYFQQLYLSQSTNVNIPTNLGGSLARTSTYRGASNQHYLYVTWPYNSNAGDLSQKVVMKIAGGITSVTAFAFLTLTDTQTGYTLLWANLNTNTSVYRTPSKSVSTGTNMFINNVVNPQAVHAATNDQLLTVTWIFYVTYKTTYITTVSQFAMSSYNTNTDFAVTTNPSYVDNAGNFNQHSGYPMTYDFTWSLGASSYSGRNISYLILYFTSGIVGVEAAYLRYNLSPSYFNPVACAKIGYNTGNSQWYVNITGIADSYVTSGYLWYLRVRLYVSANTFYYTSSVYNYNGLLEFTATNDNEYAYGGGFRTSSNLGTPANFALSIQRYTKGYYELSSSYLNAKTGLTTNKLFFKFLAPYNISQVESFSFISSSTSYPAPTTVANGIYCMIQPTTLTFVTFGAGLYAPCTYSSGIYQVQAPVGGLAAATEYLLTIIDRKQLVTSFNMPVTPQRIEISIIYNNQLDLQYGDVYTLDYAGQMTTYSIDHAHLISGQYDMLGFRFNPLFTLPAASTTSPVTESILSFEIESNYYDTCLGIQNVFAADAMSFYNGVYYSHFSSPAVGNANTRILCGQNTQGQNWAPIKLTTTDYGAVTAGTNYYFRFPLITFPSGTAVPLTYKVKLLSYSNNNAYPTIMNQFRYQNAASVSPGTYNYQWAGTSVGNNAVQQTTLSLSFYWTFNIPNGVENLVKFKNNNIGALTSISNLPSVTNGDYNYQYYPNINLCSFIKANGNSNSGFSLGTFPTSIDSQSFTLSWVLGIWSSSVIYAGWFGTGFSYALNTLSAASSWSTSTFTKVSGLLNAYSWNVYSVSWMANYLSFPEGSYMVLTFPSAQFSLIDQYCLSYSGFIQGISTNSNLVCKRYSPNQILIAGYSTLSSSASLSISLYLQLANLNTNGSVYYYPTVNIVVFSSAGNVIINADTNSYSLLLTQTGPISLSLSGTMTVPYTKGNSFPLFITFQLKTNTLVSGDYLVVDFGNWVLDAATAGVRIFKYQLAGAIYWVPSSATLVSGNIYNVPVYLNYSMTAGVTITLNVDTLAPSSYYGAMNNAIQWNSFKIYAYKSSTLVEQQITRIWTQPYSHVSLTVAPSLNYISATALYEFSVTPNISASAGDSILIEFTTSDDYKTNLFPVNLGVTIPSGLSANMDCNEFYNTRVISASTISCRVYQGNNGVSPSIPATIVIPILQNIAANTAIQFNIINLQNPASYSYPIGITFKLASACSSQDTNNLCSYYKSSTYLSFINTVGVPGYFQSSNQLTFSPSRVSATNTVHTITAPYSLANGDFLTLTYYTQVPIPTVCTITSGNGYCYSYPSTNTIIIKAKQAISSPFTFTLSGMTNPYQNYYGDYTFKMYLWKSGSITNYWFSSYSATTITTDPVSSTALGITFAPTLTPNYQLKYSFNNIALITINNMLQNSNIQQIYIAAPAQITIDTSYCNATMQTYPGQAKPYPYRFVCTTMSSNWVRINLQSDFPTWNSNFTSRNIYIYLKYQIANSKTVQSNSWTAYSYTDPTSTSWYYLVSQATGLFPILQYQLPFLYVINFPTKSFSQRTCAVGQQCMFYGFLYPTTPSTSININRMTFLLPKEFGYSSLQTFDSCTVQATTTTLYTFSCGISRNNSQITIGYTPTVYNQLYNLLNLDNSDATKLFTAPSYPGDHYQMQVNLWSNTNALVESQYVNITTVYGYYLSVPSIVCKIPLDASTAGLIDLQFVVGTVDILPSYINSADNSITSAIQLTFANTFAADLGTGLSAGSNISCINVTGLTFSTMGSITCRIFPSVSTVTYPTIIVTGYDRITAGATVRIRLANLKSLPAGITDYIKLGVSLTYYNYGGVKGYIYQPVSFVVGPTTAPIVPIAITYGITEVSTNLVGELSNYTLAGSIGSSFQTVTTNDFFVVTFPSYVFEGRFNLNTQALCSRASGNVCSVFGLASQIYIQPSASVSVAAFNFTINKLLNAAYKLSYVNESITLYTLVNNKINALGNAYLQKYTQFSPNVSAIVTSVDSIYGGDSGINYYFTFQLNSYLPENGKVSITFPSIYISLFTVNSNCYLRSDSQALVGPRAYCSIISSSQLVIIPNGVLLSTSQAYYFTVTNITNPNLDLTPYKFTIQTFYFTDVYSPSVISSNTFASPILSLITVKQCQLTVNLSVYNTGISAQYQINLICPSPIKQASQLKLYLSWNPPTASQICSGDSSILYSTQCSIQTEYIQTTKMTFLSIFLRSISAQKQVSITGTIPNGNQGNYQLNASISYNGFVYLNATSNQYYISSTTASTSTSSTGSSPWQSITVKNANYPLNRYETSIYTFGITNIRIVASAIQITVPSGLTQISTGIICGWQSWTPTDNYFNLMIKQGTNSLACTMIGQTITVSGLTSILTNLSSSNFLYLTIYGIINPATSLSLANFTFSLITSSSTLTQAAAQYVLPLSLAVSNAPAEIQIGNITLSNNRYFVMSNYTFTLTSQGSANVTIVQKSNLGLKIDFPVEYNSIWLQIPTPASIVVTINNVTYSTTNITLTTGKLFAIFSASTFTSQLVFKNFTIGFLFRNPNVSIDCTAPTVFKISLFDFKANSIFVQSLSNNVACPTFTSRLFSINVTGNTKISAGSSSTFVVTLDQPAQYLLITPSSPTSAITFNPTTILFSNYTSTRQNLTISAASGLNGNYNITFTKNETNYTFYNDIQFTTVNIYTPTSLYNISVVPFNVKSVGIPIIATITLQVENPADFLLLFAHNCNSGFVFSPSSRISIAAKATTANFAITYKGSTIPPACQLNFTISSLTTTNFVLSNPIMYLSASLSIDKTSTTPPMLLQMTTTPTNSSSVGRKIVTSGDKEQQKYTPNLYSLKTSQIASNSATFLATTSDQGTVYYAVVASGTPQTTITPALIYNQNVTNSITYGSSTAVRNTQGVNTVSTFTVTGLSAQITYLIAAYLNSTVGSSSIVFSNFTTAKASNGAAIKIATSAIVNTTTFLTYLSNVLRIDSKRLFVLTVTSILTSLQSTYQGTVMNSRSYIYQIVVAPDLSDDSIRPIDLLNTFASSSTQQAMLQTFVSQYNIGYTSTTREIVPTKPKIRSAIKVLELSHDRITISVGFWERVYVYGIIVQNSTSNALSSQIIAGLDSKNNAVVSQHYVSTQTDDDGNVNLTLTLLSDNTSYTIFVTAECLLPFKPRLSLSDTDVLVQVSSTQVNLNLMKNQNQAFNVINKIDPKFAKIVQDHITNTKLKNQVIGANKNKKNRKHK